MMKKFIFPIIFFVAPLISFGQTVTFDNPLGNPSFGTILSKVLEYAMILGGLILTFVVVWSAFVLMFSMGDPEKITKAKNTLLYGIIGYVILLLAEVIRRIIVNLLK